MTFNDGTVNRAFKHFVRDRHWRKTYLGASEAAKKRLKLEFWAMLNLKSRLDDTNGFDDLSEFEQERDKGFAAYCEQCRKIELQLTFEDADYLFGAGGSEWFHNHCAELLERREAGFALSAASMKRAMEIVVADWPKGDREVFARTLPEFGDDVEYLYDLWKAVGGNGEECVRIGEMFARKVDPDREAAFSWFRRGAFCGSVEGCRRLAAIYEDMTTPHYDMARARYWYQKAVGCGSIESAIDLGARLTTWDDASWAKRRDPDCGFRLLYEAAKKPEGKRARLYLGRCYEEGLGTPKDLVRAALQYDRARRTGYAGAKDALERVREKLGTITVGAFSGRRGSAAG